MLARIHQHIATMRHIPLSPPRGKGKETLIFIHVYNHAQHSPKFSDRNFYYTTDKTGEWERMVCVPMPTVQCHTCRSCLSPRIIFIKSSNVNIPFESYHLGNKWAVRHIFDISINLAFGHSLWNQNEKSHKLSRSTHFLLCYFIFIVPVGARWILIRG